MKTFINKIASWNEIWDKQSLSFLWFAIGILTGALAITLSTQLFLTLFG